MISQTLTRLERILKVPGTYDNILSTVDVCCRTLVTNMCDIRDYQDLSETWLKDYIELHKVNEFTLELEDILQQFSMEVILSTYRNRYDILLSKVNYLGLPEETAVSVFKAVANKRLKNTVDTAIDIMAVRFEEIDDSNEKRAFTLMLILYKLKLYEYAAIIASAFIVGGTL